MNIVGDAENGQCLLQGSTTKCELWTLGHWELRGLGAGSNGGHWLRELGAFVAALCDVLRSSLTEGEGELEIEMRRQKAHIRIQGSMKGPGLTDGKGGDEVFEEERKTWNERNLWTILEIWSRQRR